MNASFHQTEFPFEEPPPDPPKKKAPARTVNADAGNGSQKQQETKSRTQPSQGKSPRKGADGAKGGREGLRVNPAEILMRLGVNAVLLPIKRRTKYPNRKEWQMLSYADTQTEKYQRSLKNAPAIGVLLGSASGGLCSIDFDDDDFLNRFSEMNPELSGTLTTKARRGGNLWMVLEDHPPPTRNLVFQGKKVGEFRSDKSQTIIAGMHPDGFTYRRLVDAPPLRIPYSEIRWPEGTEGFPPSASNSSQSSESSPSLHTLNPLHNIGERIKAREEEERKLAGNSSLARLYRLFIAKRFTPRDGSRNQDLVAMVTFLFRAVSRKQALALARAFHQTNQDIFPDPLEQHMYEAEFHYTACDRGWRSGLSAPEAHAVESLPENHVEAFRICCDLAAHESEECPAGQFYLSCNDLADRLGLHPPQAQRIFSVFESLGWLRVVEKGTRHRKGQPGRATRYRWVLAER
jgi:hypothetical protein